MKLAFDIKLQDNVMYIYDVSIVDDQNHLSVNTIKLEVFYNGETISRFSPDVIDYLLTKRESFELYKIAPSDLGMSKFIDGFYTIKYTFGNFVKENNFIIFAEAEKKYQDLILEMDAAITVNTFSMISTDKDISGKVEQLAIVNALFDELKITTNVNDSKRLLQKINRILEIINT
jgi:hypothetical protein